MTTLTRMLMAAALVASGGFGRGATCFNVRDFGACGDGATDDTAAIQRAADAAYAARASDARCPTRDGHGGIDAPFCAVVFPAGTYCVSNAVDFTWNVALLGEGGATVVNANPAANTFHCRLAHRLIVQGLTFVGGAVQVKHWTKNRDVSYLHVADCVFRQATGTSLVSDSYKDANGDCNETGTIPYNNSTLILVERCTFRGNATAVHLYSDGVTVRDCLFVAPPAADREQIRAGSGGRLGVEMTFRDSGIVYPGTVAPGTAAIRYDGGRVVLEHFVIKSEEDLTAVRSHSHFNEYGSPSMLDFLDVRLATGDAPVVLCAGDDFPNRILACELVNKRGGKKKLVTFDREPTSAAIDEKMFHAQTARCIPAEQCLAFSVRGLDPKDFDVSLPPALEKYRQPAAPADWTRPLAPRSGSQFARELPSGKVFRDETIGSRRKEGPDDDTEKVAALLAAAEAAGGGIVELPARWVRISHGFRLPDKTLVTCRGRAGLELTDGSEAFFTVDRDANVDAAFERILFTSGGSVLSSSARQGRVRFLDCAFYGQNDPSLLARAGEGNGFVLEVSGGQACTPHLYRGDAETTFDPFWYQEMPDRPKGEFRPSYAAIVNEKGGRLTLRELLGVPCYFLDIPKDKAYSRDIDPAANGEIRWVDNYGTFLSLNVRYGGEWGGITPIFHFGAAKTFLEGGVVELNGGLMRSGAATVVADTPAPDVTVCRGKAGGWRLPVEVAYRTPAGDYEAADGVRIGGCAPFSTYGWVWPKDPAVAQKRTCRFTADFTWDGQRGVRLELETAHAAEVWLNGERIGKADFCAPWGLARVHGFSLAKARPGRNRLEVEVANVCDNEVHGGRNPAFFRAQVISGEHALAWSGVGGDFSCGELKPCHARMRTDGRR